jgi:hypothetical protein
VCGCVRCYRISRRGALRQEQFRPWRYDCSSASWTGVEELFVMEGGGGVDWLGGCPELKCPE